MKLVKIEKISFALRLKDLLKVNNRTQEWLSFETGISTKAISSWMKGTPLTRNKEEKLKQIADLFDVDPDYLDCKQVEKRKKESIPTKGKEQKGDAKLLAIYDNLFPYMERTGIRVKWIPNECNHNAIQTQVIENGCLATYEYSEPSDYHFEITIDGRVITLNSEEIVGFAKDLDDYMEFKLLQKAERIRQ